MSEIVVNNLSVTLKNKKTTVKAIDGLSLTFKDGDFSVIIGPSGCGKTTLLRTLLGLIPYEGDITLDGVDIYDYDIGERNFAYVSQDIVLQPHATVFENIAYPLRIRGMEKSVIVDKVNELANELHISECLSRKPRHISIGQAQRTAIARALIKNATFYFFDEPFSNLDQVGRNEGKHLLLETIRKYHASVVYVTHSIQEATSLADHIFVMDEGKIIFSGSSEELYKSEHPTIKALIQNDDYAK